MSIAAVRLQRLGLMFVVAGLPRLADAAVAPPKTPKGLPACVAPLWPTQAPPRHEGERFDYAVQVIGLSLGQVHIETSKRGTYAGQPVTEYRGWVDPDAAVSALTTMDGRAFALVPDQGFTPVRSLLRYSFRGDRVEELQVHSKGGIQVLISQQKNGERDVEERQFATPVHDYLSGFLLLRSLPPGAQGCAVMLGNQKAYTLWIEPQGQEVMPTPNGTALLDRFVVHYGSDKNKSVRDMMVWLTPGPERIPVRAQGLNKYAPVVTLTAYRQPRG